MGVEVKSLIGIFVIKDGEINLLMDNKNELFTIICNDEFEKENYKYINNTLNIEQLDLKQCFTFSEKKNDILTITVLYMDIINAENIEFDEYMLCPINKLNHNIYINKLLQSLKEYLMFVSSIKKLYPEEFILPEIQKIYEEVLDKKFDRRNFRKKLIKLDVIEDLNKMSVNKKGRPAKLYKFKNINEDRVLF